MREYAHDKGDLNRIIFKKMAWLNVMLGSMCVFVGSLVPSLFRFDLNGIDWLVLFLWGLTVISIFTSILGFNRASKLGKLEDEIKDSIKPRVYVISF